MKMFVLTLLALFAGCVNLSSAEKSIVGTWTWKQDDSGLGHSGWLKLHADRTYQYEQYWKVRVETLAIVSEQRYHANRWDLIDGKICLSAPAPATKQCQWRYIIDLNGNYLVSYVSSGMLGTELEKPIVALKSNE